MSLGALLTDARLSERMPVTARLMRAYRNNIRALAFRQLHSHGFFAWGGAEYPTYGVVWSFPLFIPDSIIGPSGVTLTLKNVRHRTVSDGAKPDIAYHRAHVAGAYSTVVQTVSAAQVSADHAVTWAPTGNSYVTVEVQGAVVDTDDQAEARWDGTTNSGTLLTLEPAL